MNLKIKDVLQRDPAEHSLVNQGQARITRETGGQIEQELRGELCTFVCEGEYAEGIQKVVSSFLANMGKTNQRAAWVSGFYGSGKSHLLKMMCHLWQDTAFSDGTTARGLVPHIPDDLRALLRELDIAGRREGGLLAAAGALPGGTIENVRLTILGILLRAVGLPEQYPQARFCLWLKSQGYYDKVKTAVEAAGKVFETELNNLYVSGPLAKALLACDPDIAADEKAVRPVLRSQFPPQTTDIGTAEFLAIAKEALLLCGRGAKLPCTLLILDEAQQYISDSLDRSVIVTEVVEAVSKQLDSRVMVVAAGQSALTDVPLLHKMMDRFTIRVPLSDVEVETVTRKVLLQKKPSAVDGIKNLLESRSGEIDRQLQNTSVASLAKDREVIVDDYPLLPVRRRFWEHCFRQIDAEGTHSQLRSQLRIVHDAVAKISGREVGAVLPGDELYEGLAPEMVTSGVLLREINERILQVHKNYGPLAGSICGLVFLIGKLPREGVANTGVRATKEHIADLLVWDLNDDNGKFRNDVGDMLDRLADKAVLLKVGDEYRIQTREGSEWDAEFRKHQSSLNSDSAKQQFKRDEKLYAEAERIVRGIKLIHGAAKEARQFSLCRGDTPPTADSAAIPVWIRDGWSCAENDVRGEARKAGVDSPVLFVFIPRQSHDELRRSIVDAEAARQTITVKGGNMPTPEGQEAQQSMKSRLATAEDMVDRLIGEIVGNAKLFQGGGNEELSAEFEARIRAAANDSLIRLFPRFHEADTGVWGAVVKRARDGADHPFQPAGHTVETEKHPVCQQVLATVGAGKSGGDVRKELRASPYGWPQDAIDAALIALHRSQHLKARLNGVPLQAGQLDQNKIAKSEFQVENVTLGAADRIKLRKLFQKVGITCKSGEEAAGANQFVNLLFALAREAGGEPPLPAMPSVAEVEKLQSLLGNEQLLAIRNANDDWEARIEEWSKLRALAASRQPAWDLLKGLARHAEAIAEAKPHLDEIAAIRDKRLLLESSDPVAPVKAEIARILRDAVNAASTAHQQAYERALGELAASNVWTKISPADQHSILIGVGLAAPAKPDISTDEKLRTQLGARPLPSMRAEVDAISARVSQAIERAARLLEPRVQTVALDRETLHTEAEVDAWLGKARSAVIAALKAGPVLVK